jgi:hypothetical protein
MSSSFPFRPPLVPLGLPNPAPLSPARIRADRRLMDGSPMDGCRCPDCFSLREYMLELTGRDHGLPAAPGHGRRLRVVERPHSMTCDCRRCEAERAVRAEEAERVAEIRQPWEPKRRKAA